MDIITRPNELNQSSLGTLIRNLYPATRVPDIIVIKVVGGLGHGRLKPSYSAQAALLKWLIMVYDVLEDHRVLSQLYSVLFNLLDTSTLRYTPNTEPSTLTLLTVVDLNYVTCCPSSLEGSMSGHSEYKHCGIDTFPYYKHMLMLCTGWS